MGTPYAYSPLSESHCLATQEHNMLGVKTLSIDGDQITSYIAFDFIKQKMYNSI